MCLKQLSKNKTPSPDKIPNSILRNLPHQFHTMLFLFFLHCYKQKTIPTSWKTNHTILLYKKGIPTLLSNHRPIALANTIYKLFTSTLTTLLSSYEEQHQILHNSQEGFRQERCTSRQIQLVIAALEDAKFSKQDIYLLYIDFTNAFGSIDHARLLALMADLGYPEDAISIIGNIYSKSYTKIIGSHFDPTQPIPIQRSTIQGDTLSSYLFIFFLEPLLRWLARDNQGYNFKTSKNTISSVAYADDLVIISSYIAHIQPQLEKINKFCQWAGMGLGIIKCALTGCPNKSKLAPQKFTTFLQTQNINFRNQAIPILHQNEPYKYLGIYMVPSLTWKIQTHATTTKIQEQCKLLKNSCAIMKQKIHITETVIRAGIVYGFYAVPFSLPTIRKLDKLLIRLQKTICSLPKSAPNVTTQLPHHLFGLNAFSLTQAYLRCIGEQLRDALNDPGILGSIYQGLTNYIFSLYGGSKNSTIPTAACLHSPITRSIYLLKTSGRIHLRKYMDGSHITMQPLETKWLSQRL